MTTSTPPPTSPTSPTSHLSSLPSPPPCRRIQVSREKRPLHFFLTLTKKFLSSDDLVELSGLGLAVTTVVTIAEILKSAGFVTIEHMETSLMHPHPDAALGAPKAKMRMWIRKTPEFDTLIQAQPPMPLHYRAPMRHRSRVRSGKRNVRKHPQQDVDGTLSDNNHEGKTNDTKQVEEGRTEENK